MAVQISKILIVDDDTYYLTLLKTILKNINAEILIAESGEKALLLIEDNDFALAVLDIQMPDMDGFELAMHIRSMENRDLVPIIFLTSYFSDEIQMFKGYDNGAIDFLTKPVNKTIFINKVKVFLELDRRKRNLISINESLEKSITDLKTAQLALKESEELYHSLLRTSPDGIIITDLDGKITEASDVAYEILGYKDNVGIENKHFIEFIPKTSWKPLINICQTTTMEGLVQNIELKLNRVDGSEFIGEISCTQIKGPDGKLKAYMTDIRNISERKLLEKQIRHSERMAGIGELATGMAHEINQPLNTISLSIDNIIFSMENKTMTDNYLKNKINKVFENISRIKNIIDHVRTFSRDHEDFGLTDFDINNSISSSISLLAEQMSHKGIELIFNSSDDIPLLKGSTHRFEQVMLNLLINAKDALEEKKQKIGEDFNKKIEIWTRKVKDQVVIEVKDNGIGIPTEVIDKILLPFYTTKAPGEGTGLGLSISYGIIKELNGEIEIQSEVLKSTTIKIIIPILKPKSKR
jgi:PAS domain S-box-containing protein